MRMIKVSKKSGIHLMENKKASPGVQYAVGSVAKFKCLSSWKPAYSLDRSIEDMLGRYQKEFVQGAACD